MRRIKLTGTSRTPRENALVASQLHQRPALSNTPATWASAFRGAPLTLLCDVCFFVALHQVRVAFRVCAAHCIADRGLVAGGAWHVWRGRICAFSVAAARPSLVCVCVCCRPVASLTSRLVRYLLPVMLAMGAATALTNALDVIRARVVCALNTEVIDLTDLLGQPQPAAEAQGSRQRRPSDFSHRSLQSASRGRRRCARSCTTKRASSCGTRSYFCVACGVAGAPRKAGIFEGLVGALV